MAVFLADLKLRLSCSAHHQNSPSHLLLSSLPGIFNALLRSQRGTFLPHSLHVAISTTCSKAEVIRLGIISPFTLSRRVLCAATPPSLNPLPILLAIPVNWCSSLQQGLCHTTTHCEGLSAVFYFFLFSFIFFPFLHCWLVICPPPHSQLRPSAEGQMRQ